MPPNVISMRVARVIYYIPQQRTSWIVGTNFHQTMSQGRTTGHVADGGIVAFRGAGEMVSLNLIEDRLDKEFLVLKLNRPEVGNCINDDLYTNLAEAVWRGEQDDALKFIIFTGAGSSFCNGVDVTDAFQDGLGLTSESPVALFMQAVLASTKLLIAAVNGAAVGIGTTILLHMDLVFATRNSWYWLPFLRAGILPEFGSSYLLPQVLGPAIAGRMLLLGDRLSAEEALTAGLVAELVDLGNQELIDYAVSRVRKAISGVPHGAMGLLKSKRLMRRDRAPHVQEAIKNEFEMIQKRIQSGETKDALDALSNVLGHKGKL